MKLVFVSFCGAAAYWHIILGARQQPGVALGPWGPLSSHLLLVPLLLGDSSVPGWWASWWVRRLVPALFQEAEQNAKLLVAEEERLKRKAEKKRMKKKVTVPMRLVYLLEFGS